MLYTIILLDKDGYELFVDEEITNLKDAKSLARSRITEKEFLDAGAYKVEVRDDHSVNVWDKFAPKKD